MPASLTERPSRPGAACVSPGRPVRYFHTASVSQERLTDEQAPQRRPARGRRRGLRGRRRPLPLHDARLRWLKGNYDEGLCLYEDLAKDAKLGPTRPSDEPRPGKRGRVRQGAGRRRSSPQGPSEGAGLLARQAELLYLRGRWDESEKAADAAIDAGEDQFLARWIRGQVYRDRGDMKKADAECKWFVRTYVQRDEKDDPIKDPEELVLIGLAGPRTALEQPARSVQIHPQRCVRRRTSTTNRIGRPSTRPGCCSWKSTTTRSPQGVRQCVEGQSKRRRDDHGQGRCRRGSKSRRPRFAEQA